jgi:hypothetical protein
VTDAAGKLLPGTKVNAAMPANGLVRETLTSSDSSYAIPDLPLGVSAEIGQGMRLCNAFP